MSKYLKLFETTSQYNEYITSIDVVLPNVSVAKDALTTVYFNPYDYSEDYLTLSALEDGEITITIPSDVNATHATYLSYSKDKSNWVETTIDSTNQTITIPVSAGEDVYLKGEAKQWSVNTYTMYSMNINSTANIIVSSNIMSLLYGDDFKDKTAFSEGAVYVFRNLFQNNTHLINAENLILPATTLTKGCYREMFHGCTALTTAPELPATTLENYCYYGMFQGCTSLTTAPELPATTLADWCYGGMFNDCTSLATAPELTATTLKMYCYDAMFQNCTALTTAPALSATTLADWCCSSMLRDCTSLTTAPELPATTLANYCYQDMFYGCTSLTTAPELPANTLANYCYSEMFRRCTSLNNITMLATTITASNCLNYWVFGVPSTGTFTKAASMTSLPTGDSGIPSGWTVIDK